MTDFLFDDVERTSLDIHAEDDGLVARLARLRSANVEDHKGDFAIVGDLVEALMRYRHLIRGAYSETDVRDLTSDQHRVFEILLQLVDPALVTGGFGLADHMHALGTGWEGMPR